VCEESLALEELPLAIFKGPNHVTLNRDKCNVNMKMGCAHQRRAECLRRMYSLLEEHSTVVRHKRGLADKPPMLCGSFETEFQIL